MEEEKSCELSCGATGMPSEVPFKDLFLAYRRLRKLRTQKDPPSTHLEENFAPELVRTRQLLDVALHIVQSLLKQSIAQDRLHEPYELLLLLEAAVDFHREDDGIGRSEEGVLSDCLEHLTDRDLRSESEAVSYYRFAIIPVPYVHCEQDEKGQRATRRQKSSTHVRHIDSPAVEL